MHALIIIPSRPVINEGFRKISIRLLLRERNIGRTNPHTPTRGRDNENMYSVAIYDSRCLAILLSPNKVFDDFKMCILAITILILYIYPIVSSK